MYSFTFEDKLEVIYKNNLQSQIIFNGIGTACLSRRKESNPCSRDGQKSNITPRLIF